MAFIEVLNGNRFGDFKAEERKKTLEPGNPSVHLKIGRLFTERR